MTENFDTVELETGPAPAASILWLHGLGADAHDFEPIVPALVPRASPALRFIFPNAPVRPVTINGGYAMRAWYDIISLERGAKQDEAGMRASDALLGRLIARENARGIPSHRIFLAGFSQGGVMAILSGTRYPERLAGIIGLSCYMALADSFDAERAAANAHTPIFMAHGTQDPMVDVRLGEETRARLATAGYDVEWHAYPMPHSVSPAEIADLSRWLARLL